MGICYIVGAGECKKLDINKKSDDMIIAADGGYRYLLEAGIEPDMIIGDFDSLGVIPDGGNVIKLNPVKDVTDMYAASEMGIEKGYSEFHFYGACGGRFDHTLANIQLAVSLSQKNIRAFIHDGDSIITAITDDSIEFSEENSGYISVFSHSDECTGVYIKGLKYPLENAILKNSFPLGVSNEFVGCESKITIGNGTAVIVFNS